MRLRKHSHALVAIAAFNFVLFFPLLFMGRVISPNDVFFNFDPWALAPHAPVQNSLLNDPPTSYLTQAWLLKNGGAWNWNPFLACGVPGVAASPGLFSPFGFLPLILLPLSWNYTVMVLLKLNVAFWFAYAWLREERLGKKGAAIGALVAAGAGVFAVRWLWPSTNASALYPAILWIVRRIFNGKRNSVTLMTLLALAYAVAHFPAAMAYGAYVAVAYVVFLAIRERRLPVRRLVEAAAAAGLALLIASPSLVGFAQFVRRSGYLAVRESLSTSVFFPLSHFRSFLAPDRLGNDAYKNWLGDPTLGMLNNYIESTVYLGLLTIPLAALALLNRRTRSRWFWVGCAVVIVAAMFGLAGVPAVLGRLPGFKYSSLARAVMILPLPAAYLAAAGTAWVDSTIRRRAGRFTTVALGAVGVLLAFDLGVFAGRFYPYLDPSNTVVAETPTIAFLRAQPRPFRVAPFFNYLWPNAAEMFGVEDIRSHFSSEARYRRIIQRIDPTAWSGQSTVLQLNSLKFDFTDPLVGMLGVRYLIEHKSIDIVKWSTFAATEPGVKEQGAFVAKPGRSLQRTVTVKQEPFYAIELPVSVEEKAARATPRLRVEVVKYGVIVYSREFTPDEIAILNKVYIPLRPYARAGESVTLRVTPVGLSARFLGSVPIAGETALFYGRVKTPVVFDRELPDGRVFLNLAEVPRFRRASRVLKMGETEFLARRDIDLSETAVITGDAQVPPDLGADGSVHLSKYGNEMQQLTTEAPRPFFLASSEKLTPELRITIDGADVKPIEINSVFAGVVVPAGRHTVVFSREVGRGWWLPAAAGLLALLGVFVVEVGRSYRLGSATRMIW